LERICLIRLLVRLALVVCGLSLVLLIAIRVIEFPQGDAARGEVLYFGASSPYLPCFQCHELPSVAPGMGGLSERVLQERLSLPQNAGQTVEEYLAESVIDPQRYIVPPYNDLMPAFWSSNFSGFHRITLVDLQDIVAYMMTL